MDAQAHSPRLCRAHGGPCPLGGSILLSAVLEPTPGTAATVFA